MTEGQRARVRFHFTDTANIVVVEIDVHEELLFTHDDPERQAHIEAQITWREAQQLLCSTSSKSYLYSAAYAGLAIHSASLTACNGAF